MLTNTKIKLLKASHKLQRYFDSDGLYFEISPTGSKGWRFRYKNFTGNWTMKSLGSYPEITLERARELRDDFKSIKDCKEISFEQTALEWLDYKGYSSEKNKQIILRRIESYLLPDLGQMILSHIRPRHIIPILKRIESRGFLDLARRVQNITSQIFKYGVQNLYCETNPAEPLQGCTKKPMVKHMPAIVDQEGFSDLLRRIDLAEHMMPSLKLCLQIAPYVFLRSESIRMAKPDHINFDKSLWVVPRDKMGREHWIPLTEPMITILKKALEISDGDYLFNGSRPRKPLSENTLNIALRSIGIDKDVHVFHGFRSSFSTLAREHLQLDNELIELQLGHVQSNKVRAAYDRSQRLAERRKMMEKWSQYIELCSE